jgi:hypothetical protein
MLVKIHSAYRYVVAICDKDILGKKFEEGKFILDVKENFFNGDEVDEERLIEIIRDMVTEDATFNVIGEKSINTALSCNLINKTGVKKIQGVPYALVLL